MNRIRVLIVDDAVVVRKVLRDVLSSDPAIEVVGVAPNGRIALDKLTQVNPDVVVLDVEMPEMDGLATLTALRKTHPKLPVIMFSRLTDCGAETTLAALALGANDYVTKPEGVANLAGAEQHLRDQLIPKVKIFGARPGQSTAAPSPTSKAKPTMKALLPHRIDAVAIGVSTGGPNALAVILPSLPADFAVPIVIVQHMPPVFTKLLAERLSARSRIGVSEAVAGETLTPGHAYLAPGDYHVEVAREAGVVRLRLHQGPQENSCRPAADVLFRSVAATFGPAALGLVLTGIGQDGLNGCQAIQEAGGRVIVQDQASSVVWGMPGLVEKAGLADRVLHLDQIGPELTYRAWIGRPRAR